RRRRADDHPGQVQRIGHQTPRRRRHGTEWAGYAIIRKKLPPSLRELESRDLILPGYLLLCLVLGGASAEGIIANAALQLLGVAAILWFAVQSGAAVPGRPTLAVFAL